MLWTYSEAEQGKSKGRQSCVTLKGEGAVVGGRKVEHRAMVLRIARINPSK